MDWQREDGTHGVADRRMYPARLDIPVEAGLQASLLNDEVLSGDERTDTEPYSPVSNWFFTPKTTRRTSPLVEDSWEREVMDEASLSEEEVRNRERVAFRCEI